MANTQNRKHYSYGAGRVDVFPFKLKDFKEMCRLCLVKRDRAVVGSHEYMRWYRNYIMLILGCNTGCRIQTLLTLTPKNIAGGFVHIYESKTGKQQNYEINQKIFNVIDDYIKYLDIKDNEYIFHTFRKLFKPMTRNMAYKVIQQLAKEVGINYNVGTHSLRKSYGRFTYDETGDIHLVQRMLGHSNPIVTQQYICLEDSKVTSQRKKSTWGL